MDPKEDIVEILEEILVTNGQEEILPHRDPVKKAKEIIIETQAIIEPAPVEPEIPTVIRHQVFDRTMRGIHSGNVLLVGPAGAGKTTIGEQCAEELKIPFYFSGAIQNEFKLLGFMNAYGNYVTTDFRRAYEGGGLFMFDELDASLPQAVLTFNAALANDAMDFPDAVIKRHKDFHCIASANTYGYGATRKYVGRNQLDAATLDRFIVIEMDYDERMELRIAQDDHWTSYVQRVRMAISKPPGLGFDHIVSPRASIMGAKLFKHGEKERNVVCSLLWKGLEDAKIKKVLNITGKYRRPLPGEELLKKEVIQNEAILNTDELLQFQVEFLRGNRGIYTQSASMMDSEKVRLFKKWLVEKKGMRKVPGSEKMSSLIWEVSFDEDSNEYFLVIPDPENPGEMASIRLSGEVDEDVQF